MSSEGHCPTCGMALGISGLCYACELDKQPVKKSRFDPTCKQCGASMNHSRLYGYYCSANREHAGIVWPGVGEGSGGGTGC